MPEAEPARSSAAARRETLATKVLKYSPMRKILLAGPSLALGWAVLASAAWTQAQRSAPPHPTRSAAVKAPQRGAAAANAAAANANRGIEFAMAGECEQSLPLLEGALPHLADKKLVYAAAMAQAKCGMMLHRMDDAVEALSLLNREFPDDPQVLYDTYHSFSDLANAAAGKLIATQPASTQAMEIQAESLEAHGQTDQAGELYRKILAKDPETPGIHYRLGRLLMLKRTPTAEDKSEAKKEFEEELQVVPDSAQAEYMLGALAWDAQDAPGAIQHFSNATKDDSSFLAADLGLGIALNAAGRYAEAIPPLEKYVQSVPDDPGGHYQLAIAYARTGKKQEAQRQLALQRAIQQKNSH